MSQASYETVKNFLIASHGDLDTVKKTLAQYPELVNICFAWADGNTERPIQAAAHVGNREVAEYLLEQGAPLEICTAAMLGQVETVKKFLSDDPSLANAKGGHGISVMFHAAIGGSIEIADLLAAKGYNGGYDLTVHMAVGFKHKEMAAWLLDGRVTPDHLNAKNFQGMTALDIAKQTGQDDIAALLRQYGAKE
jgi:ankyrin repeat protein